MEWKSVQLEHLTSIVFLCAWYKVFWHLSLAFFLEMFRLRFNILILQLILFSISVPPPTSDASRNYTSYITFTTLVASIYIILWLQRKYLKRNTNIDKRFHEIRLLKNISWFPTWDKLLVSKSHIWFCKAMDALRVLTLIFIPRDYMNHPVCPSVCLSVSRSVYILSGSYLLTPLTDHNNIVTVVVNDQGMCQDLDPRQYL